MDLQSPFQAIVAVLFLFYSYKFFKHKRHAKNGVEPPKPRSAWPILGHLPLLAGQTPVFRKLAAMADTYGPIFSLQLGMHRAVVVSSKEMIKDCFITNDAAFMDRPETAAMKYLGYHGANFGLGPHGPYWRKMRKVTTLELLSDRRIGSLGHVRAAEVGAAIRELSARCGGTTTVDMAKWFRQVTRNMILKMIAGKRYDTGEDGDNESEKERFTEAFGELANLTASFDFSAVVPHLRWLDLQGRVRAMKRNAKKVDGFMSSWVEEHLQRWQKGQVEEHDSDFIYVMLSLFAEHDSIEGYKTETVIKALAQLFILAGTETPALTMTWGLSLLLNHKETLKGAQEELDLHVGKERWAEESDINNLPYLQAIVKETLRLYPSGPLSVPREARADCYVGGYHVPKGTTLIVNLWKLHRDPNAWADPGEFRPDRFLPSHERPDVRGHQLEYLPYSTGRRMCPGITASMRMVHLTLARVIQGFNFATPMDGSVDMREGSGMALSKARPVDVILTPRLSPKLYGL
ncbi:cytochrome P450 CYP82D47-like [Diospyros lotus]|uniref:cytochrome P450 CYP82D47-like n=1 Tax=Diospyros lotus TaxID=55363 RepID=UPI00224CD623|nr:cytochrome P450 CYP82D47-like [Diospyros lotus]